MKAINIDNLPKVNAEALIPSSELNDFLMYDKACEIASDTEAKYMIPNENEIRSQITSSHLFRKTQNELLIYTEGFRKNIFNDQFGFKKYLEECLKYCENVQIIVDNFYNTNITSVVRNYQRAFPERVKVFKANKDTKKELQKVLYSIQSEEKIQKFKKDNPIYHFVISDAKRYRLEYDADEKPAKVYFNDPENAHSLREVFHYIKDNFATQYQFT
jgi:hypothetical protein